MDRGVPFFRFMNTFGIRIGILMSGVPSLAASVGDVAVYSGSVSQGNQVETLLMVRELTEHHPDGTFTLQTYIESGGRRQTQLTSVSRSQLVSEEAAQEFVAQCGLRGGVPELLTITSGEALSTCKVTSGEGINLKSVHVAVVPFGLAQSETRSGNKISKLFLQRYVRGSSTSN